MNDKLEQRLKPNDPLAAIPTPEIRENIRKKLYMLTLGEVLQHPLQYSKGGFFEILSDVRVKDVSNLPKKYVPFIQAGSILASIYAFGLWSLPHELIHAGINKLTGGINHEIVLNKIHGADFIHHAFPDIESRLMIPFIGGYVRAEPVNDVAAIATTLAPYLLTPLGVYFIQRSAEKQTLVYWTAGIGLMGAHAGGIMGVKST